MSAAKLNVWVTGVGEPCRIDMRHQWYVHVLHCNGELLSWCGRVFTNLATKCGHVEIEIPPRCYMVAATWSPAPVGTLTPQSLGNHITHVQVVRADCGDHVCVTLFPPTFHFCGVWWQVALREAVATNRFPAGAADAARRADEAVNDLLRQLPPDPLAERMLQIRANPPQPTGETQPTLADQPQKAADQPKRGDELA